MDMDKKGHGCCLFAYTVCPGDNKEYSFGLVIARLGAFDYPSCNASLRNRLALMEFSKVYEQLVGYTKGLGSLN